ncbi:hypothetical protein [Salininema proteolyticum]|uniref:GerMN domain-containing protein n=1 Tax=Salininema proteolyticum TaxID=1607685 RepID=A0ABV8U0T1_9ACTN
MKTSRIVAAAALAMALSGCGIGQSDVRSEGEAPAGLALGPTLYFVEEDGGLVPSVDVALGRLGTAEDAIARLVENTGSKTESRGLTTEVPRSDIRPIVFDGHSQLDILLPFSREEVSPTGLDQIVCTARRYIIDSGRSSDRTLVHVSFTDDEGDPGAPDVCPILK